MYLMMRRNLLLKKYLSFICGIELLRSISYLFGFLRREGLNCFAVLPQKETIPIMNRITNTSVSSVEHLKEINKTEKSIFIRSSAKLKHTPIIEPQYDEIIIPNWTYSTSLGVVYNPIREKRIKVIKRNVQKKTKKDFDPNVNSTVKLSHNTQVIIIL
jgi:hypothetical protein